METAAVTTPHAQTQSALSPALATWAIRARVSLVLTSTSVLWRMGDVMRMRLAQTLLEVGPAIVSRDMSDRGSFASARLSRTPARQGLSGQADQNPVLFVQSGLISPIPLKWDA